MSSLSGSSSPDPLHLASSPLAAHTFNRRAPSIAHSSTTPVPRASPSKSFLMDTGDARIKVTVQPVFGHERQGSHTPSRRSASRTTTVPLRTGESSPARRRRQPTPAAHVDSSFSEIARRSSRKRKGTPGNATEFGERRSSRRYMHTTDEHAIEEEQHGAIFSEQSVPSSEVRRRRSLYPMRNQRYQRLSAAREDLDDALQAAIGGTSVASSSDDQDEYLASDGMGAGIAGGELTTANEDFTMITGASLASISFKANATMLDDVAHEEDEMEGVDDGGHHLTSSPPQKALYPDITEQVEEAKTPMPEGHHDDMDWKSTEIRISNHDSALVETNEDHDEPEDELMNLTEENIEDDIAPVRKTPSPAAQSNDSPMESTEESIDEDIAPAHKTLSPAAQSNAHSPSPMPQPSATKPTIEQDTSVGAPNPADEDVVGIDDDIWAEEASRGIDDSVISTTTTTTTSRARNSQRSRAPDSGIANTTTPRDIDDSAMTTTTTTSRARNSKRSLAPNNEIGNTTTSIPPTLSEQADRPRRAKLPRTWRQTSGMESSYADIPAQPAAVSKSTPAHAQTPADQPEARSAQRTSGDEAESGRSSGVLTPPTTDDDDSARKLEDLSVRHQQAEQDQTFEDDEEEEEDQSAQTDDEDEEADISGFTNPGAADTQLEAHHRFGRQHASDEEEDDDEDEVAAAPHSGPGSHVSSPVESGEDTGFFWQSNVPQVYRSGRDKPKPQRRKPVDLSAILRMDSSKVEDDELAGSKKSTAPIAYSRPQLSRPIFTSQRKPAVIASRANRVDSSPNAAQGNILPSPLRRSLLRGSKALEGREAVQRHSARIIEHPEPESRVEETQLTVTDDSLASKASDQRQLLDETRATTPVAKKPAHERLAVLRDSSQVSQPAVDETQDASYEETDTTFKNSWPEHSYEENLNVASPQKINVNFNDSTLSLQQQQHQSRPNLLAPRGPIQPLFEKSTNAPIPKPSHQQQENSTLFTRLSTTFWSAVTRPHQNGPPPTPAPFARTTEQTVSLSLRAQLRSRYGVLLNSHPWTMAHMRTLHRMLNSLESGRRDSIVPTHAPLPGYLEDIVGEGRLTATGRSFRFEQSHACVVQAFVQLLVAPSLFEAMERGEVEWLGDAQAAHLRGEMGGRGGGDVCFKTLKSGKGAVGWEWVVGCLGCCVVSNVEMGVRWMGSKSQRVERTTTRQVEMSVMGDGEGDGRVREWFEREGGGVLG